MHDTLEILDDLHSCKIDFQIANVDGVFNVLLGSRVVDVFLAGSCADDLHKAVKWLMETVWIYYPDSKFTKKYKR